MSEPPAPPEPPELSEPPEAPEQREEPGATEASAGSSSTRKRLPTGPPADRILLIRLGAMGDVVRTLPSVAAIREAYPGAHLTWLVEPVSAGVVECSGLVDEVLVFPRRALVESLKEGDALAVFRTARSFVSVLRERRFDLSVDFHGLLKSGVLSWLSGAPVRFGYAPPLGREGSAIFANRRIGGIDPEASRFDRNEAMARAVAPATPVPGRTLLRPSALAEARLTARLRAAGRELKDGFVLLHAGSSVGTEYKRYPSESWVRVAQMLNDSGQEVWIAAGANRQERSRTEEIVQRAGGALVLAPETRSFDDLLALIRRASVFVACDSGPLHAASLSGIPVVQLLGPTHPSQNEPWRETPWQRVHVPVPCSPCRRGCAEPDCMRLLPPSGIVDAVEKLQHPSLAVAGREGDLGFEIARASRQDEPSG